MVDWKLILAVGLINIILAIFVFQRNRDNVFYKYAKKSFPVLLTLPFLDVVTTVLFVSKVGIEAEYNGLMRVLFENLGFFSFFIVFIFASTVLVSLLIISGGIFSKLWDIHYKKKNKIFKDKEHYLSCMFYFFIGTLIGVYTVVYALNLFVALGM